MRFAQSSVTDKTIPFIDCLFKFTILSHKIIIRFPNYLGAYGHEF